MAKNTATASAPKSAAPIAIPGGTAMDVPLSLIVADGDFNARKDLEGENDEGHDLKSLSTSMKEDGQLSPVLVAVVKEYPGKYWLISGFRRFKAAGLLGWATIRANIFQPKDKKGQPLEAEIKDLLYLNLIENEARKALNSYERGSRYHELVSKHGETGNQIAKRVALDPSYVNRLINGMKMAPQLLKRWEEECRSDFKGTKLLTTDKINILTKMKKEGSDKQDWEAQVQWLENTLHPKEEDQEGDEDGEETSGPDAGKRTSLSQIKRALEAAKTALKDAKASEKERIQGVVDALKFAIKPSKIEGVLTLKDGGKVIVNVKGEAVAAPKA